jgi:putative restriction endonuclease
MNPSDNDHRFRLAAFCFLEEQTRLHGPVLFRSILAEGFITDERRIPLIGPQGIFKPAAMEHPLSITTVPVVEGRPRPYEDEIGKDGLIRYRYRGRNPDHPANVGLRRAMQERVPLVYNYGLVPGRYQPEWPVYIVGNDPESLSFTVSIDDHSRIYPATESEPFSVAEPRRKYITCLTQRRLHQESFRQRVLRAYREQCAICRLRHEELLEAAHILPDGHPRGAPTIPNGLSLCKLHHAAFDRHILGIHPDYRVEVREDILQE